MSAVPTLRDVAVHAGVHVATVSRALNPETRHQVNAETAARIISIARDLGYRPNALARGLRTARSTTVGVLLPDITNPLFPPIVRGIEEVLLPEGYTALIANTDNAPDQEEAQFTRLRQHHVDGFIVATARRDHPLLRRVRQEKIPLVLVNRTIERGGFTSVVADDTAGVTAAVRHLIDLGHRDIAFLAGPSNLSTALLRLNTFKRAAAELGVAVDGRLIERCEAYSEAAGDAALSRLIAGERRFTAVLASNDLIALGCYDALERNGLSCPGDISVIGFNDMPFIDKLRPPLTSVHVPHHEMGRTAARLLLKQIRDGLPRRGETVQLPVELVVRGSTAAVRP
ncbi:LacI family DNA-binding transcriptional regulator [Microtetraspora niveoalba]|uniref:LacI family DNA-binding transcriptional regulator n=1 Tax=Microtetraspora niveoalba TaxID=46175 RepID=UPI000835BB35|nr:LacI family DNA-binding transcriptional regulator [Microtetraspora niveoalba]